MVVGCRQNIIDESDCENADDNRGSPSHAGYEHLRGTVDLLHGDQADGNAAKRSGVGPVAVEHSGCVDAESHPGAEHGQDEAAGLREKTCDGDRCRDTEDCAEHAEAGFLQALTAGGESQDSDRDCRRGGGVELEPEARVKRQHDAEPDPHGKYPGINGKSREDHRLGFGSGTRGAHRHRASPAAVRTGGPALVEVAEIVHGCTSRGCLSSSTMRRRRRRVFPVHQALARTHVGRLFLSAARQRLFQATDDFVLARGLAEKTVCARRHHALTYGLG